jgi:hypothetical protein
MKRVMQNMRMGIVGTKNNKVTTLGKGEEDMRTMKPRQNTSGWRPLAPLIMMAVLVGWTSVAQATLLTVVASDSFSKPNGALNGTITDTVPGYNPLTWIADPNIVISGGKAAAPAGLWEAGVPFSPSPTSAFSLAADIQVLSGDVTWEAIGFKNTPGALSGQIWVLLRGAPYLGTAYNLGLPSGNYSGSIPGYDYSGVHPVVLQYDPVSTIVSLTIDGQNVFNQPESGINLANISYAGMTFAAPGYIDNFVLSVAAPEPSTVMLLGVGGGLLLWRKRRNV